MRIWLVRRLNERGCTDVERFFGTRRWLIRHWMSHRKHDRTRELVG